MSAPAASRGRLRATLELDFGTSYRRNQPAMEVVLEAFPWTLKLTAVTVVLAMLIAMTIGPLAAYRPASVFDRIASVLSLAAASTPEVSSGKTYSVEPWQKSGRHVRLLDVAFSDSSPLLGTTRFTSVAQTLRSVRRVTRRHRTRARSVRHRHRSPP